MRHRMIEEKHRGHDLMHAEMLLILFGSIMVAQILLFVWRQNRPRYAHFEGEAVKYLTLYTPSSSSSSSSPPLLLLLPLSLLLLVLSLLPSSYPLLLLLLPPPPPPPLPLPPSPPCRSFQSVTLLGLWVIPLVASVYFVFWIGNHHSKSTHQKISIGVGNSPPPPPPPRRADYNSRPLADQENGFLAPQKQN